MATRAARAHDTARCFALVALSLLLLPVSLALLLYSTFPHRHLPPSPSPSPSPARRRRRRTILVTGVGMAKGLALARAFHLSGHRVIGADVEHDNIPCPGRVSRALAAFHPLPAPLSQLSRAPDPASDAYVGALAAIARRERADLWVSCSGVASAPHDAAAAAALARASPPCRSVQLDAATTETLHAKDAFASRARALGMRVPETTAVDSRAEALAQLGRRTAAGKDDTEAGNGGARRFVLKPAGVADAFRGDMTLLPLAGDAATRAHVARLPIGTDGAGPWVLQQFVRGGAEYCTHALVVRDRVRAFVACPSAELLMHYEALADDRDGAALGRRMLAFTREWVARSAAARGEGMEAMMGHLSFDFMVDEGDGEMYAIECNPRAHTAVVLFAQPGEQMHDMVDGYLAAIGDEGDAAGSAGSQDVDGALRKINGNGKLIDGDVIAMPPPGVMPRYWIGHDLVALFILPLLRLVTMQDSVGGGVAADLRAFFVHVLTWKEGTFEVWDPLPFVFLYHVYWPATIFAAWWRGRRWSRANVSTTKMFAC